MFYLGSGYKSLGSDELRIDMLSKFEPEFASEARDKEIEMFQGKNLTMVHSLIATIVLLEKRVRSLEKKEVIKK